MQRKQQIRKGVLYMKKAMCSIAIVLAMALTACGNAENASTAEASYKTEIEELKKQNEELSKKLAAATFSNAFNTDEEESSDASSEASSNENMTEEQEYIKNDIVLKSATVGKCTSYEGDCVGISDISIKNKGERDLAEVYVTVYFQDADGKDVFDSTFKVIGNVYEYDSQQDLKANYSFQMSDDKFYEIENLADDIDITKNRVEISDIEFE